jgi:polysaccharide export outer membrane protein
MKVCIVFVYVLVLALPALAQQTLSIRTAAPVEDVTYVMGPDDQLKIWALGVEEISDKPVRIDPSGNIDLPIAGRVHAAGLSVEQLKSELEHRLAREVRKPEVTIEIVEYGSQPVTVLGAVNHPGVLQLSGRKTVAEILSMAGGLSPASGPYIKISREANWGKIPLQSAQPDSSGSFTVATLKVQSLLAGTSPTDNILIRPHDTITVPTAEMVYVVGAVKKPGSFALNERESVSVLQALSMAEGLGSTPKAQDSKILRTVPGSGEREEIPVDLKKILAGKGEDQALRANDILFVPDSTTKKVAYRAAEAAVQAATGVIIWGPRF